MRASSALFRTLAGCLLIGAGACGTLIGLDDVTIVDCLACDGGPLDAGVQDTSVSDGPGGCPAGRGPIMARVGGYCIDTTEVTNAQYAPFLNAVLADPAIAVQPRDTCGWNTDFNVYTAGYPDPRHGDGNDPVRGVDWCDAYAFCKWAGKRLCGSLDGGASGYRDFASPQNEWYLACSSNRKYTYTFGSTFDSRACNGDGTPTGEVAHVTAFPRCHSPDTPFSSLYDMTGNVLEWENSCASSATDSKCLTRGGWFRSPEAASLACDKNGERARDAGNEGVGIRCCSP
ncbi:formylglycine-generating enzyme family protein [Pendulispora brunnea]|uniref:Formylglycine-generating enzyme family protein n=1 Tax=Pendulispora brunnea TaxID=2905690 RepID=A0ABZ2KFY7_9BACT